jgi:hypothetical protein
MLDDKLERPALRPKSLVTLKAMGCRGVVEDPD